MVLLVLTTAGVVSRRYALGSRPDRRANVHIMSIPTASQAQRWRSQPSTEAAQREATRGWVKAGTNRSRRKTP